MTRLNDSTREDILTTDIFSYKITTPNIYTISTNLLIYFESSVLNIKSEAYFLYECNTISFLIQANDTDQYTLIISYIDRLYKLLKISEEYVCSILTLGL
jgi:hypothetical protein